MIKSLEDVGAGIWCGEVMDSAAAILDVQQTQTKSTFLKAAPQRNPLKRCANYL